VSGAIVSLLWGVAGSFAQTAWWDQNWQYRRVVDIPGAGGPAAPGKPQTPKAGGGRAEGDEIAWVTIPTGGLCKPDGSDIRVATGSREEVLSAVLMVGPGDFAKVAFALRGQVGRYYVYFGNANPSAPKGTLEIRRGVLMETKLHDGKAPVILAHARQAFDNSPALLGRAFRPDISIGHNPFGPQSNIVSRHTAWLDCPAEGIYQFACSSQDASFLLIDDKEVVANGGAHMPQRDVSKRGSVKLSAGLHKLTLYHVNLTGDPVVVAAWQAPGELRIWPIPPHAFEPVSQAHAGAMEQWGKPACASFLVRHGGEVFVAGRYYQRWVFEAAVAAGRTGGKVEFGWDFGDGQTATGTKVEHVYFVSGAQAVTLTAKTAGRDLTCRNVIYNTRPWDEAPIDRFDSLALHGQIVQGYDFAALPVEANAHAVLLLHAAGAAGAMAKAGAAMLARDLGPADALISETLPLVASGLAPAARAGAYLQGEKFAKTASVRAALAERAAGTMLDDLADPNAAMATFTRVVRDYGSVSGLQAVRAAKIGIGDVWRARGDLAEARKAYAAVGYGPGINPARVEIAKGGYAWHVEQYLRDGQFADAEEYIETWGRDIPADKLEGYWSLLVARKCMARKDYAGAAREAAVLVKVNPRSNYAAELLMLAAKAQDKLGKSAEAAAARRQIVQQYPESPLAEEAKAKAK
jgi:tetratricopeptide (TPR) repeat protein